MKYLFIAIFAIFLSACGEQGTKSISGTYISKSNDELIFGSEGKVKVNRSDNTTEVATYSVDGSNVTVKGEFGFGIKLLIDSDGSMSTTALNGNQVRFIKN